MKTRNILLKIAVVLLLAATSCSEEFLEEKPYSSYAAETLSDASGVEAALKGLHYTFGQLWTWSDQQGWLCLWQVGTDVCSPGGIQGVEIPFFKYEDLNPENAGVNYLWSQGFRLINNANNALKAIGENGEAAKKAEALFFRAWMYNLLVTLYGDIPLLTEPTSSARTDYERTPVAQINDQIVEDLKFAAANLPDIDKAPSISRANKYMALQTLGEVYLRINKPDLAEAALTEIINSGKFQLMQDRFGIEAAKPGDYFHDMFIYGNQRRSQGNKEAIWTFELEYTKNVAGGFTNAPQHRRVWVPAYHNVPGMAYEVTDPTLGKISTYGGRGNGRMRPSNWVKYQLYQEGDMRNSEYNLTRNFRYNALNWSSTIGIDARGFRVAANSPSAVEVRTVKTGDPVVNAPGDTLEAMFPYTRKWDSYDPADGWGWTCIKDFPMMRLGETYLLRAEARFKNSNSSGAADDINALRNRAFKLSRQATGNPDLGKVSSAEISLDFILDERARELFAEELRRLTLMRTGTLIDRAKLNKESTIKGTISGLDSRINLWPIPLSEIQRNKDVTWQNNPGY